MDEVEAVVVVGLGTVVIARVDGGFASDQARANHPAGQPIALDQPGLEVSLSRRAVVLLSGVRNAEHGPVLMVLQGPNDPEVSVDVFGLESAPRRIQERVPAGWVGVDLPTFGRRVVWLADRRRGGRSGLCGDPAGLALVAEQRPLLALAPIREDADPNLTARGILADIQPSPLSFAEDRGWIGKPGLWWEGCGLRRLPAGCYQAGSAKRGQQRARG